jgi:GT2 family glycosyltransferase
MCHPSAAQTALENASLQPSVLVVILNWNNPRDTLAALDSVHKMDYPNYSVAVIDNGSTDDSLSLLSTITTQTVQLVTSPQNLGFTGGCNLGFDIALRDEIDFVWLLNSDAVTQPNTLSSLVHLAQSDPHIGLVSPVIASLEDPTRLINAGGLYRPEVPACEPTKDIELARKWSSLHPDRILLLGTALLVRTDLIRAAGPFDPDFFAYWEDTDLSLRSVQAGFLNKVDFNSVVFHSEKLPATEANLLKPHFWYYLARNEIRFWKKHEGFFGGLKPILWTYRMQMQLLNRLHANQQARQAILAGLWDGLLNKAGPYHPGLRMPPLVAAAVQFHSKSYPDKN